MKIFIIMITLLGLATQSNSQTYALLNSRNMYHEMQHGFILSSDDKFGSHLVATGHHSRQTEIIGELSITTNAELEIYTLRKSLNTKGESYFLFQAQNLDLPSLKEGQVLSGHIVEAKVGTYDPKNIIVKNAIFKVEKIILNIENPFFSE